MYKMSHWKTDRAFYSFEYAGRKYHGSQIVSPDHCFCDVAVYFDPHHPSTNALVEYRRKARQDYGMMVGFGYASIGLAAILACVLVLRKPKNKPESDYSSVS